MASIPTTRSPSLHRVVCHGYAASSSEEGTFRRRSRSSVPAFCWVMFFDNYSVMEGCHRWVPERGSRGKAALGRRAAPSPPAPLRLASPQRRAVLERLLLLPVVRRCPPSCPRCRLSRRRRSLPPSGRACVLGVRLCGGPPGHTGSAARVRLGARSLFSRLGQNRAPAVEPACGRGGPGRCRGGGARGKGRCSGCPGPCL